MTPLCRLVRARSMGCWCRCPPSPPSNTLFDPLSSQANGNKPTSHSPHALADRQMRERLWNGSPREMWQHPSRRYRKSGGMRETRKDGNGFTYIAHTVHQARLLGPRQPPPGWNAVHDCCLLCRGREIGLLCVLGCAVLRGVVWCYAV